ncbi:transmembrane protein, putative [Medicago truncatula]|uniref:Transmembrane protein, putative n=1 Tax=Medicago truncatula TaxID=3880 RepID=G7L5X6_MEDTR|nr:transmembrane protein, putative [Medicago truncatula]
MVVKISFESHTCIKVDGLSNGPTLILSEALLIMVIKWCVLLMGVYANKSVV